MIGVFTSTFLITVMVNLASGYYNPNISAIEMTEKATVMTQYGFISGFSVFGGMFLSICLSFFLLTTIVGWYYFAESNMKMVFNSKARTLNIFKAISITALVLGTAIEATFVWKLADMFMGIMAIPNIVALFLLSKEVRAVLDDYDSCVLKGDIHWDYEYENLEENKEKSKKSVLKKVLTTTTLK